MEGEKKKEAQTISKWSLTNFIGADIWARRVYKEGGNKWALE